MNAIHKLPLWQKFALLGVLALCLAVPLAALLVRAEWQYRQAAEAEHTGLPAVRALAQLLRDSQAHRGLSASMLTGAAQAAEQRRTQAQTLDKRFSEVEATLQPYQADAQLPGLYRQIQQAWQSLSEDVAQRRVDSTASFQRHTAMIEQQMQLLNAVADVSGLILDPESSSYHLVVTITETLPRMTELLGQTRAQGVMALNKHELGAEQRALISGHMGRVQQLMTDARRHLDRSFGENPENVRQLGPLRSTADEASDAAMKLVREQLLAPEQLTQPPQAYFAAMTAHIDAQFKLADAAFDVLTHALDDRIGQTDRRLALALGLVLAVVAGSVLLVLVIARSSQRSVQAAEQALAALARGELGHAVPPTAADECGRIAQQLGQSMAQLAQMVGEIKQAGGSLGTASVQIASGNADLSARTEATASSLQQAAASMDQINASVQLNAENARQATEMAQQARDVAAGGGAQMDELVRTMAQISQSAQRIADITGVIDGIAFQTNILALNAAVEAARAGDAGRGFAVVASEVRSLAQRSAQAAREIKGLIGESGAAVDSGAQLVAGSRQTMDDIVRHARQVSEVLSTIGHATAEQATGIGHINVAVAQMEQSTQQNAALVEESAAAADSLRQQAQRLVEVVGRFRVADPA